MGWEEDNTRLMPQPLLSRLVTESKQRIHPRLRTRDEELHADDFVREEATIIVANPIPRERAERLAVVALATAFGLGVAALLGFPF
jgi:hypothetical protein